MINLSQRPLRNLRGRIAGRPGLHAIVRNTSWLAADKVVRLGFGLVVGVLIARALGPQQFGLLSFVLALVTLCGAIGSLGLDTITIRSLVADPSSAAVTLGTVFALKLAGAAAAALVVVALCRVLRPQQPEAWQIAAIIGGGQVFMAFDAIDFWFQSRLESRLTVLAKNAAFLIASVVRVLIVIGGATVLALAWATALEYVLAGTALALVYVRRGSNQLVSWRIRWRTAQKLLGQSWPLVFSGLVIAIYMRLDQVMLATMSGDTEVGVYSVAVRLAEVWYFVPVAAAGSTLPTILRSREASSMLFEARMAHLFALMALVGYGVAVATTVLAGFVVPFLYGSAYAGSIMPLIVLGWTGILVCLGVARENWMLAEGLMKWSLVTTALGAAANIALNIVLIPPYGALGAAIATLIAQLIAVLLSTALFRQTRPVFRMQLNGLSLRVLFKSREAM
jgi:PST family polysaccharide transporter